MEYTYAGLTVTDKQYAAYLRKETRGECPFCGRGDLRPQYGVKRKHIVNCPKKPQMEQQPLF